MQINSVAAPASSPVGGVQGLSRQSLLHSSMGVLTPADHKMLQAASGLTFHWPPQEDEGFPPEAVDIASVRSQQLAAGFAIKELTPADLMRMQLAGTLSEEFVRNATAYLEKGTVAAAKTPESFRAAAAIAAAKTAEGVRAGSDNGGVYL